MPPIPRRRIKAKLAFAAARRATSPLHEDPLASPAMAPSSEGSPGPQRSPADELEARLAEPEEGPFLAGLERRVIYPTLIEQITDAGQRIIDVLTEYDSPDLFLGYESLEFEVAEVRERAAFGLGWEHGSADGRAEAFRSHAPGLSERAKRLADQARALVVNAGLTPNEAVALLLETAWAIALSKPTPAFER
ncbi:MAG: hypothetical protein MUF34_13975 [Polyangiaceae bacterium]|jgi:hypothetical protein|nr:hypothetical protein [Polyangiaceae bacterium]